MAQTFFGGGHSHTIRTRLGSGQAGPSLGLYKEESSQTSSLGLPLDVDDGSVYRYSHYVAAVTAGKLAALDISVAGFASIDGKFTDSAGTAKDDYGTDDDTVYLTDTDTFQSENDAENVWAGGYLFITDGAGEGYKYRIKEHPQPEVTPATAGAVKLVLHDKLEAALDSESSCEIKGHPYKNLKIADNGVDMNVKGIPIRGVTAAYYAWTQTWGWANCLADVTAGTAAEGTNATLSDSVNGAFQPMHIAVQASEADWPTYNFADVKIGFMGSAIADSEYGPLFLQLNG